MTGIEKKKENERCSFFETPIRENNMIVLTKMSLDSNEIQ